MPSEDAYGQQCSLQSLSGNSPGLGINLLELNLMGCNWFSFAIEYQKPSACGTLINGSDEGVSLGGGC
jgi:hypothetical protein